MKKVNEEFIINTNIPEQTPKILLKYEKPDLLYEKAFLSPDEKSNSEFCRNTACWD